MTERITQASLERALNLLNRVVQLDHPHIVEAPFSIDWQSGRPRLVRDRGSVNVSVRGTKREVYEYIHVFIYGYEYAQRLQKEARS